MNQPHTPDDPLRDGLQRIAESSLMPWHEQISSILRTEVEISLHVVQECRLGDTLASLSDPNCSLEILNGDSSWLVDIGPCLVMPLAHRLLGGGATEQIKPERAFTRIERRLMRCIARPLVQSLSPCWSALTGDLLELGNEIATARWADWETDVFQLAFLVQLDRAEGYITLCLPAAQVLQHSDRIANWQSTGCQDEHLDSPDQAPRSDVTLSLNLPLPEHADQDFDDLEVGEILSTGVAVEAPLQVHLQGVPVCEATAGEVEGNLAAQLTAGMPSQDDPESGAGDSRASS